MLIGIINTNREIALINIIIVIERLGDVVHAGKLLMNGVVEVVNIK